MRIAKYLVTAVLAISTASLAEARGPYGSIKVAGWSGGAFTDNETGKFSNCIASANYKSGITFGVLVRPNYEWMLAFTNKQWSLTNGYKFPIVLNFDNQKTFNVVGTVLSVDTIVVPMPDDSQIIRSFRAAKTLSAFAQGTLYQFDLAGTSVLMGSLVYCAKTMNDKGIAAATDFTNLFKAASAPAPATQPVPPAGINATSDSQYQIEAMQVATNFILKAALDHPKLLDRDETPASIASAGAAWRSETASGFVRIIPADSGMSGLEVAGTIVGNDAKGCKGKFASARNTELIDSATVFRGMSSCEDSDHATIAEYFILPRKKGGFYLFSVSTPLQTITQQIPAKRDELNAGFKNAAYTAVK